MLNSITSVRGKAHCTLDRAELRRYFENRKSARYDNRKSNMFNDETTRAKMVKLSEGIERVHIGKKRQCHTMGTRREECSKMGSQTEYRAWILEHQLILR